MIEINRHGARVPKVASKTFGVVWPYNSSFVTPVGIWQHEEIGRDMRWRYIEETPFLSPTYNQSEIYYRATNK